MYIEYTSQGFNIIGLSAETLTEIIRAFRSIRRQEQCTEVQKFIDNAEHELTLKKFL
jgi:hypothetical protein